jgi:hypothetical protein
MGRFTASSTISIYRYRDRPQRLRGLSLNIETIASEPGLSWRGTSFGLVILPVISIIDSTSNYLHCIPVRRWAETPRSTLRRLVESRDEGSLWRESCIIHGALSETDIKIRRPPKAAPVPLGDVQSRLSLHKKMLKTSASGSITSPSEAMSHLPHLRPS